MSASDDKPRVARLVTFLGTGNYDEAVYRFEGREAPKTCYVCRAVGELLEPSDIAVLATEEAEQRHGAALKEALRAGKRPAARFVRIPIGSAPEELWRQFEVIKTELRGSDGPVMLDITHGFRSQPFFGAAVATFVHAVDKKPPELRVCYAAYEAKDAATGVAPIWELTEFVALLDWSRALATFLHTGRAEEAGRTTERLGRELRKASARGGKPGNEPDLAELGKSLIKFGADLETLRTGDLLIGREGTKSSAARLLEAARGAKGYIARHAPPLADILDRVAAMAQPIASAGRNLSADEGHKAVTALAELYLDLGRYSEALATVREGWINLYAKEPALCPGGVNFDEVERRRAEGRARKVDRDFRSIGGRRNDLLHAQYKPRKDVQDSSGIKRTTQKIVLTFKTATPIEDVAGDRASATQEARGACFVNLSNHPQSKWDAAQTGAARALAERIKDVTFPPVPPDADEKAIAALAEECVARIPPETSHALVQGEFTLTVELVGRLQARGIVCLAATSRRDVEEDADGRRVSVFRFVRFRAYPSFGQDKSAPP